MSLPWFRVDSDMTSHPKVFALSKRLGDPNAGWYLVCLWSWTMRYAARGHLPDGAETALESACGWRGEAGELISALISTGWLNQDESGKLEVHDWWEKQGAAVAKAEKDSEKKREHRATSKTRRGDGAETARADIAVAARTRRDETRRDEEQHHVELASSTGQGDAFELIPSQPPTPPKPKRAPSEALDAGLTADEREVFDHWRRVCGHQRAKLDAKRRKLLRERLRDYSAEDLKAAVDGCSRSPHHQGQNDRNTRYDDLELILRDAKHVEQFMILAGNGNGCDF